MDVPKRIRGRQDRSASSLLSLPTEMVLYAVVQRISLHDIIALRSTCVKYARMFSKNEDASFITCQQWAAEATIIVMTSSRAGLYILSHFLGHRDYTRKFLHFSDHTAMYGCKTLEAARLAEKQIEEVFHHPIRGVTALAAQNHKRIPTGMWFPAMELCASVWEDMGHLRMLKHHREEAIARVFCLIYANAGESLACTYFNSTIPGCYNILAIVQYWATTGNKVDRPCNPGVIFIYDYDGEPRRGLEFSVDMISRTSRRLEETEFSATAGWQYLWNEHPKWSNDATIRWWRRELAGRDTDPSRKDLPIV